MGFVIGLLGPVASGHCLALDCRPHPAWSSFTGESWGSKNQGEGTMTGLPFQAETTVYVIVRCKLDEKVTTEAEFSREDSPSIRVEAKLENEYTVSVKAPSK